MTALCERSECGGSGLRLSATFNHQAEKTGYGSGKDHALLPESSGGTVRTVEEEGLSGYRQHPCELHGGLKGV